jgi:4-oxalocrotonate tautomerase
MPLIQVRVIKDVFSKEQKRQIISKLTDAMVSIEGENLRGVTWCVVEEVESGDWGIGGNALTTADVHALARGKAAEPARPRSRRAALFDLRPRRRSRFGRTPRRGSR